MLDCAKHAHRFLVKLRRVDGGEIHVTWVGADVQHARTLKGHGGWRSEWGGGGCRERGREGGSELVWGKGNSYKLVHKRHVMEKEGVIFLPSRSHLLFGASPPL
jgi:hypothetical protein